MQLHATPACSSQSKNLLSIGTELRNADQATALGDFAYSGKYAGSYLTRSSTSLRPMDLQVNMRLSMVPVQSPAKKW
jgi:hypothetical protein